MIKQNKMSFNGEWVPIVDWKVWFMTPKGVTESYDLAHSMCVECDWDPDLNIIPVPVAFDSLGNYEVIRR